MTSRARGSRGSASIAAGRAGDGDPWPQGQLPGSISYLQGKRRSSSSSDEEAGRSSERLDVLADISEERPTQVRLSVWDDSALWLGIHRSGKQGRRFGLEFHGNVWSLSHEEIVARFERTISIVAEEYGSGSPEAEITQIWEKAALRRKKPS